MFFSRYEYQPIYIILYNILRTKYNKSEEDIEEIIYNDGYDGLKNIIDVELISQLACDAIETYIFKTASFEFERLIEDYYDDNLDFYMGLGFTAGRNYISNESLVEATVDLICYFHNEYIYHNIDLNFPFINKNVTYEKLEKEEKDIELMIINPILSAIGSMYSIGQANFETQEFDLLDNLNEKLNDYSTTLINEVDEDNYYEYDYNYSEYLSSEEAQEKGILYKVENDEIIIVDYNGKDKTLIIHITIDVFYVRYIDGLKFLDIEHLVVIANLKEMKNGSLSSCSSLKKVTVYGTLGIVSQGVFSGTKIPSLTWQGVTYLTINNNYAYLAIRYEEFPLDTLIIPNKCKSIRGGAFFGSNLRFISAPSVEYIGDKAFGQSKKLESIKLNRWLKGIGEYAFYICESLKSIRIDAEILPPYLFYRCSSLTSLTIGKGVKELALYSLSNCSSLKRVVIPSNVHKIGQVVFEFTPLEELVFEKGYYWNGVNDNGDTISLTEDMLKDPKQNVRYFKKYDDYDFAVDTSLSSLEHMTYEEAIEYGFQIDEVTGGYCLTDWEKDNKVLVIPKTIDNIDVVEIGAYENFSNKENLEKVVILADIKTFGYYCFKNCKKLKDVTIVSYSGELGSIFMDCPLITRVESGVTYIKINDNPYYYALKVSETDTHIFFNINTKDLNEALFFKNNVIKEVYLPDIKKISSRFFYEATSLRGITIPDTVEEIEAEAFYGCTSLESVVFLGEKINKIGYSCFDKCLNLKECYLPRGLKVLEEKTFKDCIRLKAVSIPDSVEKIEKRALYNCFNLDAVDINDFRWVAEGPFGPLYIYEFYSTHPKFAAEDLAAMCLYTLTRYTGDISEFSKKQELTRSKKMMGTNISRKSIKDLREQYEEGTYQFVDVD